MLEGLDSVPWHQLGHAYGSAEDAPDLIRALRTSSPDLSIDESPLWQLFARICHQGTVYDSTAYAVPFLIDLAWDQKTPDRIGILQLLGDIAKGSSYLAVHGNRLGDANFESELGRELTWVEKAHQAVANGFETLSAIANEAGELGIAAAHVLAQLPEHVDGAVEILRAKLSTEADHLYRAGLLLLLGQSSDESQKTLNALSSALQSGDRLEQTAAAVSFAKIKPQPLPGIVRNAIIKAVVAPDLEETFRGLPWDVAVDIDPRELVAALGDDKNGAAEKLVQLIESGQASDSTITILLDILFRNQVDEDSDEEAIPAVELASLSPLEVRAVKAIAKIARAKPRVFHGYFPQWGLPDTDRGWRQLLAGSSVSVDESLPLLASVDDPRQTVRPDQLKPGQRVIHRQFGAGNVQQVASVGRFTKLSVLFDEEGTKTLMLPSDGSPLSGERT